MRVLITGGAGFIGSHTAVRFVEAGHDVSVLDDFSSGKRSHLEALSGRIEVTEADVRDFGAVASACSGVDIVIHLAAIASVQRSFEDVLTTHAVNVGGTLNVMEAARAAGAPRLLFSSSASVYGDHPALPKTEESPVQPLSPYAWHKLTAEFYGGIYERHGLEVVSLRYFNVYGPRQDPASPYSGVISKFLDMAVKDEPLVVNGDGMQTRDFIHVSDIAAVNLLAAESSAPPRIVNVATGVETQIIELAQLIGSISGQKAGIVHGERREGDVKKSYADISLMKSRLGYTPQVSMTDGLKQLLGGAAPSS